MKDNNINSVLFELQKNLEDISSAKDQVDFFRGKSLEITNGISEIQLKYVEHLQNIKSDYEIRIDEIKNNLNSFLEKSESNNLLIINNFGKSNLDLLNNSVNILSTKVTNATQELTQAGENLESSNSQKIEAINNLLIHYKDVVVSSTNLIETLKEIDFPAKLDALTSKTQLIIESITSAKQALEIKLHETQNSINNKTNKVKEQILQNNSDNTENIEDKIQLANRSLTSMSNNFEVQSKQVKAEFNNMKILFEKEIKQTNELLNNQNKELKSVKILFFVTMGLITIGILLNLLS
jgi:hypothetical protein